MFDTLLGTELPWALRFIIVFLLVLILIPATFWAVRRFGGPRIGAASSRGRQPRLAVLDAASVDARRRLILIRRDNVEHLLMIGGPTDIVVEANIVRAAARDAPAARAAAIADRPAVAPAEAMIWPLQPDAPAARAKTPAEEPWSAEPAQRQRAAEPPAAPASTEAARPTPAPEPRAATERKAEERKPEERKTEERKAEDRKAEDRKAEPARGEPARTPVPAVEITAAADQNLAEMAQRLEAALRRPTASAAKPAGAVDPEPPKKTETVVSLASRTQADSGTQGEKPARESKATRAESKSSRGEQKPAKTLYESLEQEMASLLSRPAARQ